MHHGTIERFLEDVPQISGPIALIFAEDDVEVESTIAHHRQAGFSDIVLFAPSDIRADLGEVGNAVHRIDYDTRADGAVPSAVNTVADRVQPGTWLYYCFNAEYLFFPFSESRSIREMLAFHAEERREAMLTYVIDLYAGDLENTPGAVSLENAHLDKSGYYAAARPDPDNHNYPKERQLDFFGGLRWRFEEHIPANRRRIDRIALFRTKKGLRLLPNHTLNEEEMNTYACPWHSNLTAAICSFRAAKALIGNAGSRGAIQTFRWHNSVPFEWRAQQLLDLGLIEPGQWF